MNIIKHCIRGCGYLEHCGEHPGSGVLIMLCLMSGIATLNRAGNPFVCFSVGFGLCLLVFGPMYLYGAYERSVLDEKLSNRTVK